MGTTGTRRTEKDSARCCVFVAGALPGRQVKGASWRWPLAEGKGAEVKANIWPENTGMLQMSDWLAELRGDSGDAGRRSADRPAGPVGTHGPRPEPSAVAAPNSPISRIETFAAEARARAQARADVQASARAGTMTHADVRARVPITERAVIGDELRMPVMWCEMGSCISWHSDPAALGEADIRARAIAAGWRVDALGRLTCPDASKATAGSGPPTR
jgi:hypothetical protein